MPEHERIAEPGGNGPSKDQLALIAHELLGITQRFADLVRQVIPPPKPPTLPEFLPNAFQRGILSALDKKALRTDALAAAVGSRSRLFSADGLPELIEHGLVAHHKRVGYYRPDTPPAGFSVPSSN